MSLGTMYLHNLASRAIKGGKVNPAEVKNCPKIIDQVYGDGNGVLDIHDLDDIVINVVEGTAEKIGTLFEIVTSIF